MEKPEVVEVESSELRNREGGQPLYAICGRYTIGSGEWYLGSPKHSVAEAEAELNTFSYQEWFVIKLQVPDKGERATHIYQDLTADPLTPDQADEFTDPISEKPKESDQ